MTAFLWLFAPLARWVAFGFVIAALAGGYVLKQRRDAVVAERARVETRKTNDINKATKARSRVRTACERDKSKCLPDSFFRD